MTQLGKILVPIDLLPRSMGAARYAAVLGNQFNSEIVFLHATEEDWSLGDAASNVRDMILGIQGDNPSRFIVREGDPVPVILEAARTEKADLILLPTRGLSRLSRLMDRSITAQVLRAAHCPVWAGFDNFPTSSLRPIRSILCGLSLGPRTGAVLHWAAGLAQRLQATLSVVHTSKALESVPGYPGESEWRFWFKRIVRDEICALQFQAGTDADVWLEPGRPLAVIPSVAESLRPDLLVIGKSPNRRFLGDLRTMSYDMVCRMPCPVVSV